MLRSPPLAALLLPVVVVLSCHVLLISLPPEGMVFGRGENPARTGRLMQTMTTLAGAVSFLEAWSSA